MKKLLSSLLLCVMLLQVLQPTALRADVCDTVADCIAQQERIKEEKAAKNQEIADNKAREASLELEIRDAADRLLLMTAEIDTLEQAILLMAEEIAVLITKIAQKEEQIMERLVVQQTQKNSNTYFLSLINADSISTLIKRWNALKTYNDYDKELANSLSADKVSLEAVKTQQEEKQQELTEQKAALEVLKQEREANLAALRALIQEEEATLQDLQTSEEELEKQREILSRPKPTPPAVTPGGGQGGDSAVASDGPWHLPVGSNGVLTAHYKSPTYLYEFGVVHYGIDVGAGLGASIRTIADGWVVYTGYEGGLGNMIAVSHTVNGVNYVSLYAHLQTIEVSRGDYVFGGNRIGGMGGSGGYPVHLHMELMRMDVFNINKYVRNSASLDPLSVLNYQGNWAVRPDAW